jgi:predicted acyltransferase
MGNDPDGIVGSIAATASVLLGVLAGQWFRAADASGRVGRKSRLAIMAAVLLIAGLGVAAFIPINKVLWTPSYMLFMGGLSCAAFLAVYWIVDERARGGWARPLGIFGIDALAAYVLSRLLADVLGSTCTENLSTATLLCYG